MKLEVRSRKTGKLNPWHTRAAEAILKSKDGIGSVLDWYFNKTTFKHGLLTGFDGVFSLTVDGIEQVY